jgi:hypothetical protein
MQMATTNVVDMTIDAEEGYNLIDMFIFGEFEN